MVRYCDRGLCFEKCEERETERQKKIERDRDIEREIERQKDRDIERQREMESNTDRQNECYSLLLFLPPSPSH